MVLVISGFVELEYIIFNLLFSVANMVQVLLVRQKVRKERKAPRRSRRNPILFSRRSPATSESATTFSPSETLPGS